MPKTKPATRKPSARAARRDDTSASSRAKSPAEEIRRARQGGRSILLSIARSQRTIPLPDALAALLADALDAYARGHSVELAVNSNRSEPPSPYLILDRAPDDEITTQEAAAALRVSRPTIIKAIDEGRLPARKVGKHRRVRIYDFNAFARAEQAARIVHGSESSRLEQSWGLHEVSSPPTIEQWKALTGRISTAESRTSTRKRH